MHQCGGLAFLSALVTRCCGAVPTPLECSDVVASPPEKVPLLPELEEVAVKVVCASCAPTVRVTCDSL